MISREQALIRSLFAPLASDNPGALALRDDAALISPEVGEDLVVTKDALVADVHFLSDDPADLVARKALRVNISDLAAKGAAPSCYLLAIALPRELPGEWLQEFVKGLKQDQAIYGCLLAGGDTVSTPGVLTISVTAIGRLPQGAMVKRSGAKVGDAIYVTGTIGDAALGVLLRKEAAELRGLNLSDEHRDELVDRFLLPRPRVELVSFLQEHAHAAMDISDGLAGDLELLCDASGTGAQVRVDDVPLSQAAAAAVAQNADLIRTVLSGGDDYEIVFTAPASKDMGRLAREAGIDCEITCIGEVTPEGRGVRFLLSDDTEFRLEQTSFSHI